MEKSVADAKAILDRLGNRLADVMRQVDEATILLTRALAEFHSAQSASRKVP